MRSLNHMRTRTFAGVAMLAAPPPRPPAGGPEKAASAGKYTLALTAVNGSQRVKAAGVTLKLVT